ncbi:MAG: hypothetical protein CMN76_10530 [Spirochaetaceae bacterium]|nr:hypothetical protein [Spirochaetaceae bacterium]
MRALGCIFLFLVTGLAPACQLAGDECPPGSRSWSAPELPHVLEDQPREGEPLPQILIGNCPGIKLVFDKPREKTINGARFSYDAVNAYFYGENIEVSEPGVSGYDAKVRYTITVFLLDGIVKHSVIKHRARDESGKMNPAPDNTFTGKRREFWPGSSEDITDYYREIGEPLD